MNRWLPFPMTSLALMALWLVLNQSLAPGHLLFGALVGVLGPLSLRALQTPLSRVRNWRTAFRLLGIVLLDILRSNIAVVSIILFPHRQRGTAGFMSIPLDLRDPTGLALLSLIITSTPGTLWVDYDAGRHVLLLHVLDLVDEDGWRRLIKGRYERLLQEIFE
jgi:multicomponent K+:H+ antiporter subunit E